MFTFKKIALVGVAAIAALSMSCTDDGKEEPGGSDPDLKFDNFTIGDKSYGDIDAAKTYSQTELTDAIKGNIDVVAFYNPNLPDNVIYNPCGITTIEDDCGDPELYDIPAKYQAAIKSASKVSDLSEFIADLDAVTGEDGDGVNGGGANEKWEISIADGKAFLVFSTDMKFYVVIMGGDGSTRSVALNFANVTGE
jgi:hypothetical protein